MTLASRLSLNTKIFIGLALFYLVLVFILPVSNVSKSGLNLSTEQYYALMFVVRLPFLAIWGVLYYAARKLQGYAKSINGTPESNYFASISKGVEVIVWGLLVAAILSSFFVALANKHTELTNITPALISYLYMVVIIAGLSYISAGAHRLCRQAKLQISNAQVRLLIGLFVGIGVLFCYLLSTRLTGDVSSSHNAYHLPNGFVWATVVAPNLYGWFLGIFAAIELAVIARNTPGIIYRHALQHVAVGIVSIVLALILLQYFRTIIPRTGGLNIGVALALTYGVYTVTAVGALIMATGARRLKQIEVV